MGTVNTWWFLCSLLSVWFTIFHGLPVLLTEEKRAEANVGPVFAVHLWSCTMISLLCVWNLFYTPGFGPVHRTVHVCTGWIALTCSTVAMITGFLTAWWERYSGVTTLAVSSSAGGASQLISSFFAVYYICKRPRTKDNIRRHIMMNAIVFYGGCITPAIIRLNLLLPLSTNSWLYQNIEMFGFPLGFLVTSLGARAALRKSFI